MTISARGSAIKRRAAKGVFLNISEGLPDAQLGVRRRRFTIARNSLCEVAAAVDLAVAIGALPVAIGPRP